MKKTSTSKAFSLIELSIVILIIGILIAGVTQSSRLVGKSKLMSARTLTESSPVSSIKGLVLWLEAASEKSFVEGEDVDGGDINTWKDINPTVSYKNDAQSVVAPKYVESCLNGLPCVRFDGDTTYLNTTQNIGRTFDKTIFAVFSYKKEASDSPDFGDISLIGDIIISMDWEGGDDVVWYYVKGERDVIVSNANTFDNQGKTIVNDTHDSKVYVGSVVVNNRSLSSFQYANGIEGSLSAPYGDALTNLSTTPNILQIGAWDGGTPENAEEFFHGDIGEIIMFNRALTTEERKSVEKYLGQKWGVSEAGTEL